MNRKTEPPDEKQNAAALRVEAWRKLSADERAGVRYRLSRHSLDLQSCLAARAAEDGPTDPPDGWDPK